MQPTRRTIPSDRLRPSVKQAAAKRGIARRSVTDGRDGVHGSGHEDNGNNRRNTSSMQPPTGSRRLAAALATFMNDDSNRGQCLRFFALAIPLMALLTVMGRCAPAWPTAAFPLFFLVFALAASMGALHGVVTNRLHRQHKLRQGGTLSHHNRRWPIRLFGTFTVSLFSALFFVLEAPKWDLAEWLLLWGSLPLFYACYAALRTRAKIEFAPAFYKAGAMKVAFVWVTAILCLAYGLLFAVLALASQGGLSGTITATSYFNSYVPAFEGSPSAALGELDALASFTDCLLNYTVAKYATSSFALAFVVKALLSITIFFGVVCLLGSCLLTGREMAGVFKLLPASDDPEEPRVLRRYIALMAGVWLAFTLAFVAFDAWTVHARTTQEHTAIEAFVEEQKTNAAFLLDNNVPDLVALKEREEARKQLRADYDAAASDRGDLDARIDACYAQAENGFDGFIGWVRNPFGGGIARGMMEAGGVPIVGGGARSGATSMVLDAFRVSVAKAADAGPDGAATVQASYSAYRAKLDEARTAYWTALAEMDDSILVPDELGGSHPSTDDQDGEASSSSGSGAAGESTEPAELDLWKTLRSDSAAGKDFAKTILAVDPNDEEALRSACRAFVEQAKEQTLAQIQNEASALMRP